MKKEAEEILKQINILQGKFQALEQNDDDYADYVRLDEALSEAEEGMENALIFINQLEIK